LRWTNRHRNYEQMNWVLDSLFSQTANTHPPARKNQKTRLKITSVLTERARASNPVEIGRTAGQGCRSRLPVKAASQGCRSRLPVKAAGQGCRSGLPVKAAGQSCRARLPGKPAEGCRARLLNAIISPCVITPPIVYTKLYIMFCVYI
jgi:hypothetical protein